MLNDGIMLYGMVINKTHQQINALNKLYDEYDKEAAEDIFEEWVKETKFPEGSPIELRLTGYDEAEDDFKGRPVFLAIEKSFIIADAYTPELATQERDEKILENWNAELEGACALLNIPVGQCGYWITVG